MSISAEIFIQAVERGLEEDERDGMGSEDIRYFFVEKSIKIKKNWWQINREYVKEERKIYYQLYKDKYKKNYQEQKEKLKIAYLKKKEEKEKITPKKTENQEDIALYNKQYYLKNKQKIDERAKDRREKIRGSKLDLN